MGIQTSSFQAPIKNKLDTNRIFILHHPASTLGGHLNDLLDIFIFGRDSQMDGCPRANFLLIQAYKPLIIGVTGSFIIFVALQWAFYSIDRIPLNTWCLSVIVSCILLLGWYFIVRWYRELKRHSHIELTNTRDCSYLIRFSAWLTSKSLHASWVIAFSVALVLFIKNPLNLAKTQNFFSSLAGFSAIGGFFAAGLVNFFHHRKSWSERWEACFSQYSEWSKGKKDIPTADSHIATIIFLETLIHHKMWAHPSFKEVFEAELRAQLCLKRSVEILSPTDACKKLQSLRKIINQNPKKYENFIRAANLLNQENTVENIKVYLMTKNPESQISVELFNDLSQLEKDLKTIHRFVTSLMGEVRKKIA